MKIKKLFGCRVLIKVIEEDNVTDWGLKVIEQDKKDIIWGTVKEVGEECEIVKSGDVVLFDRYKGSELIKGEYIVDEDDLLASKQESE